MMRQSTTCQSSLDARAVWRCAAVLLAAGMLPLAGAQAQPVDAVTRASQDLELGFTIGGKVDKALVKPGARVQAGDILMALEAVDRQSLVDLWKVRAESELEVAAADARLKLAQIEAQNVQRAFQDRAATQIEVDRAEANVTVRIVEKDQAGQRRIEAELQLQQAQAILDQYTLKAPVAGTVDMVEASVGEVVDELQPVLRLVVTETLWIDAAVPTEMSLRLKTGDQAWVTSKLVGYDKPLQGKVIHMSSVADASSDTRLVRVEIANTEKMPAGIRVQVWFEPPPGATASGPDSDANRVGAQAKPKGADDASAASVNKDGVRQAAASDAAPPAPAS